MFLLAVFLSVEITIVALCVIGGIAFGYQIGRDHEKIANEIRNEKK